METKNTDVPYNPLSVISKSNYLIAAKYASTLLENQILLLALQRVHEEEPGKLVSEINASEIKKLLGKNYHQFYQVLKTTAVRTLRNIILIEDPENKTFHASNIVTDASSADGCFRIQFNSNSAHIITGLKQNFTVLNIDLMCQFESVLTFRLYELLKSKSYYPKGFQGSSIFHHEYDLDELKITLGAIDTSDPRISALISEKKNLDYGKVLAEVRRMAEKDASVKKPKYDNWYNFRRQCLDVAIPEINKKSDIEVSYDLVKNGKGGKIEKIIFKVVLKSQNQKEVKVVEMPKPEDILDYVEAADEILESRLGVKDIKLLLETAGYDLEKIQYAYNLAKGQKRIQNLAGWLNAAIKNNYQAVERVGAASDKFNQFMYDEDDYDYEAIEKANLA